ncbi:MAG: hypothetical protein MZW92_06925 [Comamonadaceae bacterium]|nr:hypothetical protein [Comamonadaceae bacterium]
MTFVTLEDETGTHQRRRLARHRREVPPRTARLHAAHRLRPRRARRDRRRCRWCT